MSPSALQANRLKDPLTRHWVSRAGKDSGWGRGRLSDGHGRKEGGSCGSERGREGGRKGGWKGGRQCGLAPVSTLVL